MLFNVLYHAADFHLLNAYKCLTILSGLLRFYTKKSILRSVFWFDCFKLRFCVCNCWMY